MAATSGSDPDFNDALPKPNSGRGFRLFEVLVVLGIIALLVAFLLPATRSARGSARRVQCVGNLRQIALAIQGYVNAHGALPPAYTVDAGGRPLHSWRTLILPYLDEGPLYQAIDLSRPWDDPANAKVLGTAVPAFHCPASSGPPNTTTYLAIAGPGCCLDRTRPRPPAEITDDHGATLMAIEAGEEHAVPWMAPADADESLVMGIGPATKLHHNGGMNACFVDGNVRFLNAEIAAEVRRALMTISGNEDLAKMQ